MPVDYVAIDLSAIIAVGASTVGDQVSISSAARYLQKAAVGFGHQGVPAPRLIPSDKRLDFMNSSRIGWTTSGARLYFPHLCKHFPFLCTLFRGFDSASTLNKYISASGWEHLYCGRNKCFSQRRIK